MIYFVSFPLYITSTLSLVKDIRFYLGIVYQYIQKKMSRRALVGTLAVLSLLIFGAIAVYVVDFSYINPAGFSETKHTSYEGMIFLHPLDYKGQSASALLRLKDKKLQYFTGDWRAIFQSENNLYVYPVINASTNQSPTTTIYRVLDERTIVPMTISNRSGQLYDIQESPDKAYAFMRFLEEPGRERYCLYTLVGSDASNGCKTLTVEGAEDVRWHPNQEHTLLLKNKNGEIVVIDPWEEVSRDRLTKYSIASNRGRFLELDQYFQRDVNPVHKQSYVRIRSVILAKSPPEQRGLRHRWRVYWVRGLQGDYLFKEQDTLLVGTAYMGIFSVSSGRYEPVIQDKDILSRLELVGLFQGK